MTKIVVNMGISASLEKSAIDDAAKDLALITGRKAAISKSRHSIANSSCARVSRSAAESRFAAMRCMSFFDRLVATALPRIRDFRGLSPRSFDGRGNYSLGVNDQTIFPEMISTRSSGSRAWISPLLPAPARMMRPLDFLKLMGFPFAEPKSPKSNHRKLNPNLNKLNRTFISPYGKNSMD